MSKITLNSVGSLIDATTAQTAINTNFSTIQTAFDNPLSRDGTSPNQMSSSLDMNSNRVLNLPNPISDEEPLRLVDLNTFIGGGTISTIPSGGLTNNLLKKNSAINYDVSWATAANTQTVLAIGSVLGGVLKGANLNTTADQAITIACPSTNYMIDSVWVVNGSTSLTTAQGGFYAAASKVNLIAGSTTAAFSGLTSTTINSPGSGVRVVTNGTAWTNVTTIFLSLTTAQGSAATADIYVYVRPMP